MKAIIRTIIVVILIAAVAAIGWLSYGFREWDPNAWKSEIDKIGQSEKSDEKIVADNIATQIDNGNAISLSLSSTTITDEGYIQKTLNAIVPSGGRVEWSYEWASPSSLTISDYVTFETPWSSIEKDSLIITCIAAFDTDIIVTATLEENGDTAQCVLKFVGAPSGISISIDAADDTYSIEELNPSLNATGVKVAKNKYYSCVVSLSNRFGSVDDSFVAAANWSISLDMDMEMVVGTYTKDQFEDIFGIAAPDELYSSSMGNIIPVSVKLSYVIDALIDYSTEGNTLTIKLLDPISNRNLELNSPITFIATDATSGVSHNIEFSYDANLRIIDLDQHEILF